MSNLIVPDTAKINVAKVLVATLTISKIDLFQNNVTPDHTTTLGGLTVANFGGYAQGSMSTPSVAGALDAGGRAVITWADVTFTKTGGADNTIYGYYVTASDGTLLWCERFDNPVPVNVVGIFIKLTPKFTDKSEFSNA